MFCAVPREILLLIEWYVQEVITQFIDCATACRQKAFHKRSSAANHPGRRVAEPVVHHTRPSAADDAKWQGLHGTEREAAKSEYHAIVRPRLQCQTEAAMHKARKELLEPHSAPTMINYDGAGQRARGQEGAGRGKTTTLGR